MNVLEIKIYEFKQFYDANNEYYNSALGFLMNQISSIKGVELVSGRVKDYDEFIIKFERKYFPKISHENTTYKIIDHFSDLIGIRVVCFYLEDVIKIRSLLLSLGFQTKDVYISVADKYLNRSLTSIN